MILRREPWRLENIPRDPFTIGAAIIGFLGAGSGVVLGVTAFTVASYVVGTVAVGALLAGAQYALNKTLTDKQDFGALGGVSGINAPEVRGSVRQSAPPQRIVYGRTRIGGAMSFLNTDTPPFLYLQLLLSSRRITRVLGMRISDNDIAFSSFANNTILTPLAVSGQVYIKAGTSRLFASFRDGDPDQAIDAILAANFTSLDTEFRQRGIATATFKFAYGDNATEFEEMWGKGVGIPNPEIDVEGCAVYDPRDPTQDRDDEETWTYSNNASLVQADWLRQSYGVNFPADRVNWDKVAEAADFDDELVGNADGTFSKRHTINGVVTLNQKPREVMEAMLTANRGLVVQSRGSAWVTSSKPRTPIVTIHDGMLLGGFEFRDDKPKRDVVNTVRTRFSSSDREFQDIDGPVLERDDLITEDGEPLEQTVRLPFTSDHRAVQRLSKQYLEESRLPRALTCRVKLTALCGRERPEPGCCVRVYSEIYPRLNGLYTVEELGFIEDFSGMSMSLVEYDPTISGTWNPETDEQAFTLPELDLAA